MPVLEVVDYLRNPALLRRESRRVEQREIFGDEFCRFVCDLRDTLLAYRGLGLAAQQVEPTAPDGKVWRVFVMLDLSTKLVSVVVNPEIKSASRHEWQEDGCLSFRSVPWSMRYPMEVEAKGVDDDWQPLDLRVTGQEARCFAHETDHLNGVVMVDHMKPPDRMKFLGRVRRQPVPRKPAA